MKRLFDIILASAGLLIMLPIMMACAVAIACTSRGPILYRGERIGRGGNKFNILKFRTMVEDADKLGGTSTSEDDARITSFGKLLRKTKLDELPQFFNVLLGDMSFVGPRPQVEWAVKLYNEDQRRLLSVRPGITDHASIAFRNEAEILAGRPDPDKAYLEKIAPEKIRLGLEYVDNNSLWIDLKIIFATLRAVFLK